MENRTLQPTAASCHAEVRARDIAPLVCDQVVVVAGANVCVCVCAVAAMDLESAGTLRFGSWSAPARSQTF